MHTKFAALLISLLLVTGCKSEQDPAGFIIVENVEGVAHLKNTSTDRLIKVTYSCGGYTSQNVTLKPGASAMSDLGNARCSKATVTSARFLDANN